MSYGVGLGGVSYLMPELPILVTVLTPNYTVFTFFGLGLEFRLVKVVKVLHSSNSRVWGSFKKIKIHLKYLTKVSIF